MTNNKISLKDILVSLLLTLAAAGSMHPGVTHAATGGTITLISGNGVIGQRDPATKFTLDGGSTWQDAYIVSPHPYYSIIPGTKYLNRNPDLSGPSYTSTRFKTFFVLPSTFAMPTLMVSVNADNVATVFLNGAQIGQQPFAEIMDNFLDPPSTFTTNNLSLFHAGFNVLEFDIYNYSGPTAFDYQATVNFSGCDNPLSGLVSWWPGNGNANDFGAYNTGSLVGGVTYAQGKSGQAFKFDGTGRVEVADSDNLDITGPITLDAWVSFTGVGNFTSGSPILTKWGNTSDGTAGYGLFVDAAGYPYFKVSSTGSDVISIKSAVPLATGMYMHVAGVWTGNQAQLYVNGELVSAASFSGPIHANNVPLVIGGYDTTYSIVSDSLIGMVDEAEVYNRALSADEVSSIYFAGGAGKCEIPPPVQVFTNVRLIETIPTKDIEIVLSSATTTPYSVTNTGYTTIVEWRFGNFAIGQDQNVSFDMNLSNLIPGEDRVVEQSSQLIYNDSNNQEITVNLAPLTIHVMNSAFASTLSTDKPAYQANEDAVLGATITNLSDYARTIDAKVLIEDSSGNLVKEISTLSDVTFSVGEIKNFGNMVFNTGSAYAGDYRVHLVLSENQMKVGEAFTDFKIQKPAIAVSARATVDKLMYRPGENVTITPIITSLSSNYSFENLTALVSISSPTGLVLAAETRGIATLMPEAAFAFRTYWNTGTYPAGAYPVILEVKDASGVLLASGAAEVAIAASTNPKALLKGAVAVDKQSVFSGEPVAVNYSITNAGNIDLTGINLSVRILHVVEQTVYGSHMTQASLTMGATYTGSAPISTQAYAAMDYLVVLQAWINGGAEETLAGSYFRVEGAPTVPALSAPADGSDVQTLTPILTVNNASDPNDDRLTCEFELYADSGLTTLIASAGGIAQGAGTTSFQVPAELTENSTYYWRSRAYDGKLSGDWMQSASFRVNVANDLPTAPTVASPPDGTEVSVLTPVLTVNNATDPDSTNLTYNFKVTLDSECTQTVASTTGVPSGQGNTSWQVTPALSENTWYYWCAQADDWLDAGLWSTTAKFFVNITNDPPTKPVILSPASDATVTSLNADIVIQNSTDIDSPVISYYFEVDTVSTFDSVSTIRSGVIPAGSGTTTWQAIGLFDNTRYYVRAMASDGSAGSGWTEPPVEFFVNTANDAPTTPAIANPSNGAGVSTLTPLLSVHNATDLDRDALTYDFEVYSDAGLANLVASVARLAETPSTTSWTVTTALVENQTYYWRARVFDGSLNSGWAEAWFTVNTANDAPGAPTLLSPANGSTLNTLTPTFTVLNATDPDSDRLTYDFEVYNGTTLVWSVTGIAEGTAGNTSVTIPTALSNNTAYQWQSRAYDGDRYGPWTARTNFTVHLQQTGITVDIEIEPETLNQKSKGNWVMAEIELPHGYRAEDVDISSIRLEGTVPAVAWPYEHKKRHHDHGCDDDHREHDHGEIKVKFRRSEVIAVLPAGEHVPVHVTGMVAGTPFEGVDIIKVIQ